MNDEEGILLRLLC